MNLLRAYLTYTKWSAIVSIPLVTVIGLGLAVIGAVQIFGGDEQGWKFVQIGFGIPAAVLVCVWLWAFAHNFVDRWINKVD